MSGFYTTMIVWATCYFTIGPSKAAWVFWLGVLVGFVEVIQSELRKDKPFDWFD